MPRRSAQKIGSEDLSGPITSLDNIGDGWEKADSMRLGDAPDPAIEAASLALSGRREGPASRFASIELGRDGSLHASLEAHEWRGRSFSAASHDRRWGGRFTRVAQLAPLGYGISVLLGLIAVAIVWSL